MANPSPVPPALRVRAQVRFDQHIVDHVHDILFENFIIHPISSLLPGQGLLWHAVSSALLMDLLMPTINHQSPVPKDHDYIPNLRYIPERVPAHHNQVGGTFGGDDSDTVRLQHLGRLAGRPH